MRLLLTNPPISARRNTMVAATYLWVTRCEPKLLGWVTCRSAFTQASHSSRQRAVQAEGEGLGGGSL